MMSHDGPNRALYLNEVPNEDSENEVRCSCQDARVWLKANITEVDGDLDGSLLSLLVGTARVSVLVEQEDNHGASWASGMSIDIHIGRYEAWIKPAGKDCPPVLCGLLYLDHQSLASAR